MTAPKSGASGGCGSTQSEGLVGLLLLALFLARRRVVPQVPAMRTVAAVAVAALLAGATGCKVSSSVTCKSNETKCGDACADLSADTSNCGVCGQACPGGFVCTGYCAYATGNPFVRTVTPAPLNLAGSSTVTLTFAGDGFQAGATVRITGGGLDSEKALTVDSASSARLVGLDLSAAFPATAQVRVVNPGPGGGNHLVSNAVDLQLIAGLRLFAISLGGAKQDVQTDTPIALTGAGFAGGMTATLTPVGSGTGHDLTVAVQDSTHATVDGIVPSTLALGVYDLAVRDPATGASASQKFTVIEGAPKPASIVPTCGLTGSPLTATIQGDYLYPSSTVKAAPASGGTAWIVQSSCTADALGKCTGGALSVAADLRVAPAGVGGAGDYDITVTNPGYPSPLVSSPLTFTIKASCP